MTSSASVQRQTNYHTIGGGNVKQPEEVVEENMDMYNIVVEDQPFGPTSEGSNK